MTDASLIEGLKKLNLRAAADEYAYQCANPEIYRDMSFDERLSIIVQSELTKREKNKLARLIRRSNIKYPDASVEQILYYEDRNLNRNKMNYYASCDYINKHLHVILLGATGSGKSWIASALGISACRKFMKVRYIRMPELLNDLNIAKGLGRLYDVISEYRKENLIIIDDWLITKLDVDQTFNMLEFLEGCESNCSLIFCSQYNVDNWYGRLNSSEENKPLSEAVLERIIFGAKDPITLGGQNSVREKLWEERKENED